MSGGRGAGLSESYQKIWPIILGMLLLLVIMFRPTGLIGRFVSERERMGRFGRPAKRRDAVARHVAP
jgi:branched-chain amino acid transport system permease protein